MFGIKYPGDLTHCPWGAPNLTIVDVEFCVEASSRAAIEMFRWGGAPEALWARVMYEDGSIEDLFQFIASVESYSESDLLGLKREEALHLHKEGCYGTNLPEEANV